MSVPPSRPFQFKKLKFNPLTNLAAFLFAVLTITIALSLSQASAAVIHVTVTGDDASGTGEVSAPLATIQKAMEASEAGDRISVGPGEYQGNFIIGKRDITIIAQKGPRSTRITSAKRDSVFHVSAEGAGFLIDGFTISGGTGRPSPSSYGFDYYGGAINTQASMAIRNCVLTGNGTGTPRVNSCTFGGAIYSAGQSDDVVLVENCLLVNNFAWASGGASLTERSTIIFDRCTVWGNTSTDFFGNQGGVSAAWSGKIIVRNSILWGNGGSQLGAFSGIYATGTSGEVHYSTIQGFVSGGGLSAFTAGAGNLTVDPLFAAPVGGDFSLSANSPAGDAGDPSTPLDPDGTRADMGYLASRFQSQVPPPDSDGDGVNDYRESKDGTDPNDPDSFNPLSKGLVAYYPFEGDANDESGFGNNGVVNGATLAGDRLGRTNAAYFFNGSSFITGGNVIPNYKDGATLSCWFKSSHVGLTQGALCKPRPYGDYGGFSIGISASFGFAYGGLNTDPYYGALQGGVIANRAIFSSSSIADERWQHLLATVDGASLKFYLNGLLVGIEYFVSDPISSDRLLQIGREGQGGPQYGPRWFFGSVDEVRVYDRALSEAEIGQLYEAEAAGLDSDNDGVTDYRERRDGTNPLDSSSFEALSMNLVAHYPFDGSTLDESGYANHAVNKGATDSADRFGAASSAYDFNGVDAYMDAPPLVSDYQRNFTMSGWIKTTHVSSDRLDAAVSALSKTRDAGDFGGPAIDFREGKAIFTFNNNRVYGDLVPFEEWEYSTEEILADGNWRHYIMSIDADGLITAFINGRQVASHPITTFLEVTGASPFQIGRAGGLHAAARYFPGQIDEVRVYSRGLSAQEAAMLYRENVCGLDSDADGVTDYRESHDGTDLYDGSSFEPLSVMLLANYPFDDSWKDESGNCRDVLAPYTTFEPGLLGSSLGLAEGNSQASYWNDPNNIESPGRISNFTFSVWMKPSTLEQADGVWYHLVSAPNNAAYLRIGNAVGAPGAKVLGMGYSWSGIPGFDFSTPALTSLQENLWQHVVGVQQGVSTAIYVNGRLVGSLIEGQEILFDPANFTIGNLFNKDTFQGQIDEVRIYGRALSPAEVAALYALEVGDLDSDHDGLDDVHESNTGTFVSATDAGTDPYNPDTSGDGILDGEAVLWNFNPLTDHTQVLAFLRHATGVQSGRFALYTEGSIMDLNLGGVMIQKSGNQASVRFKVESKMDLRDPSWTDRGTYLLPPLEMPGSKGFLRIRAEQP
ncbi:MAG: LamG-like jellyroll fold domain-containing protein [Chthoniobacterales bacterium]